MRSRAARPASVSAKIHEVRVERKTLGAIPQRIVTLADAKRGDVEHTARAYACALFDDLGFDASTVNPYLGGDSIAPWIEREDRAAFMVCRTSNAGAPDFQDLRVEAADGDTRPLFEVVAERAKGWNARGNVGLVAGATYPEEMRRLREICPDMPFLVPGIGAQQGDLAAAVRAGVDRDGRGLLVSASRGVLYASKGSDFSAAARREALRLRDDINAVRDALSPAARG